MRAVNTVAETAARTSADARSDDLPRSRLSVQVALLMPTIMKAICWLVLIIVLLVFAEWGWARYKEHER